MDFEEGARKNGSLIVKVPCSSLFLGTCTVTCGLELVDGLKLKVLVIHLTEHSVLIVSAFAVDC